MSSFEEKDYKIFELFGKQWALATAGSMENFNSCTVSWGSMGTLWARPGNNGSVITVYLHPVRYTRQFFMENDTFTVSFFPESCRKSLGYMGSHSGRDGDKAKAAGLTPVPMGDSVTYKEASMTFLCRKVYQHQFSKGDIAEDVQDYYRNNPKVYPVDESGQWQPHWVFVGEIIDAQDSSFDT